MTFLFSLLFSFLLQPNGVKPAPVKAMHPFYISVTEVTQNAQAKSLEISCKFFTDDFEETLQTAFQTSLDINAAKDQPQFDKFIPAYINRHLQLTADGKLLKLTYVGFERDKESVYCYFEVEQAPAIKQLAVANTLLHDFKKEQINIMHLTVNGKRQSSKLDYPASRADFNF